MGFTAGGFGSGLSSPVDWVVADFAASGADVSWICCVLSSFSERWASETTSWMALEIRSL